MHFVSLGMLHPAVWNTVLCLQIFHYYYKSYPRSVNWLHVDLKQILWAVRTTDHIMNVLTDHIAAEELL